MSAEGKALLIVSEDELKDLFDGTDRGYRILDRGPYLGPGVPGLDYFRRKRRPATVFLLEVCGRPNGSDGSDC